MVIFVTGTTEIFEEMTLIRNGFFSVTENKDYKDNKK